MPFLLKDKHGYVSLSKEETSDKKTVCRFEPQLADFINKAKASPSLNGRIMYSTYSLIYEWRDSVPDANALAYGFIKKVYVEQEDGSLTLVYSETKGGFLL